MPHTVIGEGFELKENTEIMLPVGDLAAKVQPKTESRGRCVLYLKKTRTGRFQFCAEASGSHERNFELFVPTRLRAGTRVRIVSLDEKYATAVRV